jgi:uncharacterized protein YciI
MNKKLFDEGQRLEKADRLEEAAAAYQRVVDADPGAQDAVGRLLVVYRRLKDYHRELRVIEAALGAVEQRDKAAREKWLKAHPGAAKLGKEVLKTLGGERMTAFGTDPLVEKLLRRKEILEKKGARPGKKKVVRPGKVGVSGKKKEDLARRVMEERRVAREKERAAQAREREKERAALKAAKEAKLAEAEEKRKAKEAAAREREAAAREREAAAREKEAAARAKKEQAQPSLFIVSLRYLVPLEKIDASMAKHVAFLDKHFAAGEFLVSGRQVPRTGGIIIARGKDRAAVERIMKQDPFVRGKLASVDIVEFVGSKMGKGLEGWIRGKKIILRHP